MRYIFCAEAFLYYICLILITYHLLQKKPKKRFLLYVSFPILLIYLTITAQFSYNLFYLFLPITQVIIIVLTKLQFYNLKLSSTISAYVALFSINAILIYPITSLLSQEDLYGVWLDIFINFITTVLCILLCITKTKYILRNFIEKTPPSAKRITVILLPLEAFLLIVFFESDFFTSPNTWHTIVQIAILLFLVALSITLPILISTAISNNTLKQLTSRYEQQINAQAAHYKRLAESQTELRRFRHDFKNTRIAIEALLQNGETDRALALLGQYHDTLEAAAVPFDTGNGVADALLTDKAQRAASSGILLTFDGAIPAECLSPADICVLLGNTLDNAIEACEALPADREKHISVTCRCCSGCLFLTVCNPIAQRVKIQNNHIATTKEDKTLHGFGLYSLNAVAKRYDGRMVLSSTDEQFTVDIDLCLTPTSSKAPSLTERLTLR